MPPFIAIVDDEPAIRAYIRLVAERAGFDVGEYSSGPSLLERYEPRPGCIFLEIDLPGMNGVEVMRELCRRRWQVPIIAMSGAYPDGTVPVLAELGALLLLQKPFGPAVITDSIERALAIDNWERRERSLRGE